MTAQSEEQPFEEFDGKVYVRHDVYQRERDKVREKDATIAGLQATVDSLGKRLITCRNKVFALRTQQTAAARAAKLERKQNDEQ